MCGCFSLELSQIRYLQGAAAPNCSVLSLCCPLSSFHWWAGVQSDQLSAPSPLLGLKSDWCVWLFSSLPRAETSLEWCWPMLGLLAHCQVCSTALDGLQPKVYLRGWFPNVCGGRICSVCQVCAQPGLRRMGPATQGLKQVWL